ncbi:carboxyltransferase domain-containing protein [Anoxynatronum buryatiense]|uniref:Allophanate hydrolase subunit 1 n=1 Tax=Anoxynatronum buryatiense TaxID=489973 RepID=A0AA45WZC4_9CLOT|nr:carboxyltransferase domain-containing protein [Anoxynatronum buryatiense]SMP70738.1 Allophanate hydrolase subunit 1 [Anoxynatronum buryatiense]
MKPQGYETIMDTLPQDNDRKEVLFRQAGDGFLQVEYGHEQVLYVPDSFRMLAVDSAIKEKHVKGLIETVPGLRTNMFHFDPLEITAQELIEVIKETEESFKGIDDVVVESRLINLPIAFEDSETKKAVEKYAQSIRPDAPNIIDGYNLEYIALCNGVTKEEVKKMLLGTEWFNSGCGFWPGGGFFWPLDPRCALVVPKYNPPRTWTPEGSVGIGGPCVFTYTTATGGGYQLFGRTIPTFQFAMKHPQFKEGPFLYRNADRIRFFEATEKEVLDIYDHVHDKTDYRYDIEEGSIVVKDYIEWLNREDIKSETEAYLKKQAEGAATAPKL